MKTGKPKSLTTSQGTRKNSGIRVFKGLDILPLPFPDKKPIVILGALCSMGFMMVESIAKRGALWSGVGAQQAGSRIGKVSARAGHCILRWLGMAQAFLELIDRASLVTRS